MRESTDDAQIEGHVHPMAARVGGTVITLAVKDNQWVERGAILVQLDPNDYRSRSTVLAPTSPKPRPLSR